MLVVHLLRKHKFRNEGPKGSDWPAQVHGIIYINIILFRSICFLINLMDNFISDGIVAWLVANTKAVIPLTAHAEWLGRLGL